MSIYYGEHSIRFFTSVEQVEAYSFAGFNAEGEHCSDYSPDTWERWHLIPKEKPVFSPPGTEDTFITIPGRHGAVNLTRYTFGEPIYKQRSGSITFLIDPDYIKHRATIHSEMMAYFQGEERLAVLRDDRYYFYRGTFTVKSINPDKYWDEITLEYSLYPFKFERWSGGPWFWDDLDFETGVIRDYEKITEGTDTIIKVWPIDGETVTCELSPGNHIIWSSAINGPTVKLRKEAIYGSPFMTDTIAGNLTPLLWLVEEVADAHGISIPTDPENDYLVQNGRVLVEFTSPSGATLTGWVDAKAMLYGEVCVMSEIDASEFLMNLISNYPIAVTAMKDENELIRLNSAVKMSPFHIVPVLLLNAPVYSSPSAITSTGSITGLRYFSINTLMNTNDATYYYCRQDVMTPGAAPSVDTTHWTEVDYWSDSTYYIDNYVIYNGRCYRCKQNILTPTGVSPKNDIDNWEIAALEKWSYDQLYSDGEYVQLGGDSRVPLFLSSADADFYNVRRFCGICRDTLRDLVGAGGVIDNADMAAAVEALNYIKNFFDQHDVSFDYTITGNILQNHNVVFDTIDDGLYSVGSIGIVYFDAENEPVGSTKFLNTINTWSPLSKLDGLTKELNIKTGNTNPAYVVFRNGSQIMPDCMFGVHYRGKRL